MKQISATVFTVSLCIYVFMHYFTNLFPTDTGKLILSIAGITALLFAAVYLPFRAFLVPLFLLCSAGMILVISGGSVTAFLLEGIIQMRELIALLLIVPVIGWILKEEPYIDGIMNAARGLLNTSKRFYFGLMMVNQIIAYFLLFGSIPMMYQFINDFLKGKTSEAWEYFKGTALLRSFALTTLWVISIPSFAFAVDHLGAPLGWTIVQGFLVSVAGILLAVLFASRQESKYGVDFSAGIKEEMDRLVDNTVNPREGKRLVLEFAVLFLSLFSTIFIVHIMFGWGLLLVIPPTILLWTYGYFLIKKKSRQFLSLSKNYVVKEMRFKSQQFSLMLSAGVLIFSVNQSGIGNYMVDGLFYMEQSVPFLNFLAILPFTAIVLGFLGLGPLTVIVLVAGILQHVNLPYPPELVVLSMTSGSVISVLLSPVILPVIVLSATNKLSILKNGFQFNIGYAVTFYFIVQAYIQFMWYFIYQ
ncbi:hypothetical protein [Sediminibacillus massiliensis]|uniref:hypothetical protein n=1 Tax=Sediminibacillus massiliensis TaxID=1926277 RepID=UPI000988506A|nr:hypothetical protein [Sediminibacillus massiliensis]